jgi:hypothetical protein
MKERKTEPCCPEHSIVYRARYNDKIVCVAYKCKWEVPARRIEDSKIPELKEIKMDNR